MARRAAKPTAVDGVPLIPGGGVIRVLALDISSTHIGIAVMDGREVREVFTYVLRGDLYHRIEQCADWVRVLPMLGVEVLAIEGAAYKARPLAMIAQQRVVGIVLGAWLSRRQAVGLEAPIVEVPPVSAKAALSGNVHADKEQMIACVQQQYPLLGDISEHDADAIAVGLAAIGKLEQARQVAAYV